MKKYPERKERLALPEQLFTCLDMPCMLTHLHSYLVLHSTFTHLTFLVMEWVLGWGCSCFESRTANRFFLVLIHPLPFSSSPVLVLFSWSCSPPVSDSFMTGLKPFPSASCLYWWHISLHLLCFSMSITRPFIIVSSFPDGIAWHDM